MKLHEYQAKELLASHGVAVPPGFGAASVEEAVAAAKKLGGDFFVVKAQVHAGGRGKGRFREAVDEATIAKVLAGEADVPGKGGVQLCHSVDDVAAAAKMMLGNTLVTKQTGAEGVKVNTIYVTTGADIATELYAAVLIDRETSRVLLMASTEGGTEIEEVAEENPDAILREIAHPLTGLGGWQARRMAFALGLEGKAFKSAVKMFMSLHDAFVASDASMVEINPLVVTPDNDVIALDAKITIDDNATFRQKQLADIYDSGEDDPAEIEAAKYDLSFIKLDGSIGCMVNGAGLAMATMDIVKHFGGEPANFLDVGGGATTEKVAAAFRIITQDPGVKAIFVNIFGGIMRCDVIAEGVIAAVREVGLDVPLVVRLEGTNVEQGKAMLAESGLAVIAADSMADGAQKAIAAIS